MEIHGTKKRNKVVIVLTRGDSRQMMRRRGDAQDGLRDAERSNSILYPVVGGDGTKRIMFDEQTAAEISSMSGPSFHQWHIMK